MDASELPEAARAFVDGDVDLLPSAIDANAGEALVAILVERGDAARLQRLGDSSDKALAKRARKALHLLRTRGVAAPKPEKREFRPHGPYAPAEELSLASMIDGRGERVVWLVRSADKGLDVFEAQLSDTRGILGFTTANAPRKDWRAHAARVVTDARMAVGRVTERHARQLIEDGYKRTLAAGRVPPRSSRARGSASATTSRRSAIPRSTPRRPCPSPTCAGSSPACTRCPRCAPGFRRRIRCRRSISRSATSSRRS